uniref:Reverse transcriptase zinc-binding domain-containing protein n=1 Tax=Solanum lycopersicum TaxID=4081 RepID=A0A3Q7IEM7_SOLLC
MSPGEVWYVTINVACPTQTFILWIALLGRTRTKELLLKWNMTVNIKCVFVNHSETL